MLNLRTKVTVPERGIEPGMPDTRPDDAYDLPTQIETTSPKSVSAYTYCAAVGHTRENKVRVVNESNDK